MGHKTKAAAIPEMTPLKQNVTNREFKKANDEDKEAILESQNLRAGLRISYIPNLIAPSNIYPNVVGPKPAQRAPKPSSLTMCCVVSKKDLSTKLGSTCLRVYVRCHN